jgi:DMSO/TMAO reductase YedYZ molybdopterin-dependent catalytic subunit
LIELLRRALPGPRNQMRLKSRLAATANLDSLDRGICRNHVTMNIAQQASSRAAPRSHTKGDFAREEVGLANRNSGLPLEALRYDVTPAGMHFLLTHFDVPFVASPVDWRLAVGGCVHNPLSLSLAQLKALPAKTARVTFECAGNGRANIVPRWQTQPWEYGAVGTAEWTGTPLRHVLTEAGLKPETCEVAFIGADRGFDAGVEHDYGRSLPTALAMGEDVLVAWAMNGAPLLPQHGFPLRLVVPGWYGMASVKWLNRIEALAQPFTGYQQVGNYVYRQKAGDAGSPVSTMRVKSLMAPPGIPDWYTRHRIVEAGPVELLGRAWSGGGVRIASVAVGVDGNWHEATLGPSHDKYAWQEWRCVWAATPGEHLLMCRATDASGDTQPFEPPWDNVGFGNNAVHRVHVTVR